LEESLQRLNQLGTVLMIAAHPDDERTGVLAYFARGRHMRTAYLSLTRGEGGQNLIGPEQGAPLGVIRTQELLTARQIDGAEQFFTRAIDFGFTKTATETLSKWGRDRVLGDIVWVIRRYRPDVVILCFTGTPSDGHGQHQASAILGKEAFEAAADPKRFPAQLQYVQPWRAKRLVRPEGFTGYGFPPGALPIQPPAQPPALPRAGAVELGDWNPLLGYSYEELAVLSRSMHHSQGTGAMRYPGASHTPFGLVEGAPAANDIFDGVDTTWKRLTGGSAVQAILDEAIAAFDVAHPEKSIPLLVKARPLIAAIDDPLARIKLTELDNTIGKCAGIWLEAQAHEPDAVPGTTLEVTTSIVNRSHTPVALESARMEGMWNSDLAAKAGPLPYNEPVRIEFKQAVPAGQPYTQPYWLMKPPDHDLYTVDDQQLIGLPDTPAVARVRVALKVGAASIGLTAPVHYRYADRALGERTRPLAIVPAVAVNLPDAVSMFPQAGARTVHVELSANTAKAAGELKLDLPAGWKAEPLSQRFQISGGNAQELTFRVTPPQTAATATARAIATVGGREISAGMQVISYSHFPPQTLFPPAEMKLVRADIQVTARHIGYIAGAGDEMPAALRQLGIDVTLLTPAELAQSDLSHFDCVVAGVRAYNVRADLRANHPRLMEYVNRGGTYVVQYQTPDPTLILGPYPFTITTAPKYRITEEDAPVTFPHPDASLLRAPNAITARDFEGWVQERGLYFASERDPRYQTVLASHDTGEQAIDGGELWTRYGKGIYIFTAYSWFRQLPAGVPGAYRLFANILSAK
ncbi:MAG TPA: PIG-L family deacetylase, partial [Rhizomicrobium sp.]|nr:PIG-L family deacetylase [Rhizomicrobium sp.]